MALVVAAIFGVIVAVIVYQAQIRGLLPIISGNPSKSASLKIQTLIQEENAIISVVENASSAIVSIGLVGLKGDSLKTGTGFIADSKGIIITNKYTVSDPGQYIVTTKDGQKFEVRNIYKDPNLDLSLLLIDASNLKALNLGDSSALKLGQTIIAVGQLKQAINVSVGVVSGLDKVIQTDAFINAGNSGGPLLSSAGQVIGVNLAATAGSLNLNSAIPINAVKQLIEGAAQVSLKPILGLTYKFALKDTALTGGPEGAIIQEVLNGEPADKAGLQTGDIIIKINGKVVDTENIVSDTVSQGKIGQQIELTIWRNGKELNIKAILSAAPNP